MRIHRVARPAFLASSLASPDCISYVFDVGLNAIEHYGVTRWNSGNEPCASWDGLSIGKEAQKNDVSGALFDRQQRR